MATNTALSMGMIPALLRAPVMVAVSTADRAMEEPTDEVYLPAYDGHGHTEGDDSRQGYVAEDVQNVIQGEKPGAVKMSTRVMKTRMSSIMYFLENLDRSNCFRVIVIRLPYTASIVVQ